MMLLKHILVIQKILSCGRRFLKPVLKFFLSPNTINEQLSKHCSYKRCFRNYVHILAYWILQNALTEKDLHIHFRDEEETGGANWINHQHPMLKNKALEVEILT